MMRRILFTILICLTLNNVLAQQLTQQQHTYNNITPNYYNLLEKPIDPETLQQLQLYIHHGQIYIKTR